jgi:hypothetical protein
MKVVEWEGLAKMLTKNQLRLRIAASDESFVEHIVDRKAERRCRRLPRSAVERLAVEQQAIHIEDDSAWIQTQARGTKRRS